MYEKGSYEFYCQVKILAESELKDDRQHNFVSVETAEDSRTIPLECPST